MFTSENGDSHRMRRQAHHLLLVLVVVSMSTWITAGTLFSPFPDSDLSVFLKGSFEMMPSPKASC